LSKEHVFGSLLEYFPAGFLYEPEVTGSSNSMNVYLEDHGQIIHFAPGRSKNQASFIA